MTSSTEITPSPTPAEYKNPSTATNAAMISEEPPEYASSFKSDDTSSRSSGFNSGSHRESRSRRSTLTSASDEERPATAKDADWGIGDDARMGLE